MKCSLSYRDTASSRGQAGLDGDAEHGRHFFKKSIDEEVKVTQETLGGGIGRGGERNQTVTLRVITMRLTSTGFYLLAALYILVFVAGAYFCLFADPDESAVALYVTETLPRKCWSLLERILPKKALVFLEFCVNRALMLFYLAIICGVFSVTTTYIFPLVHGQQYVSHSHEYVAYASFLAMFVSWRQAKIRSPGIITARTLNRYDHFPYDNYIFVPGIRCKTRGFIRPARSKFDRYLYKENVARFDHYCGWVGNTIGEENYRFFLLFLLVHIVVCAYGAIILSYLFYGHLVEQNLLEVVFVDRLSGEEFTPSYWLIFQYLFDRFTLHMGLWLLAVVMGIALGMFFLYHCYLTSRNMTTNEAYKWEQVNQWYKEQLRLYNDAVARGEKVLGGPHGSCEIVSDQQPDTAINGVDNEKGGGESEDKTVRSQPEDEAIQYPGPEPKNLFDHGFVENWKEVLFPLSLRKSHDRSTKPKAG